MSTSTLNLGPVRRDPTTERFFAATAVREFPICRCTECGAVGGPQETQCPACGSNTLSWDVASGRAVVRSFIVNHRRTTAGEPAERTVVVIGELEEGPWWWAQVADVDPETLSEGDHLTIDFAPSGDELVPIFRPDRT